MPVFSRPNEKLPLEVLGLIFENLLEEDDDYELDGLEIDQMLLVCRFWVRAARSHRHLWSYICIDFSLKLKYEFWLSYAATRIERAGQSQPLHLYITSGEEPPFTSVTTQDPHLSQEVVKQLLCILAGPDGEVAKRWKSLVFATGDTYDLPHVDEFLSFPTPLLEALDLTRIATNYTTPFLPSTPSLVYLRIDGCMVPRIEDVSLLRVLELEYTHPADTAMLKRASAHLEAYIVRGVTSWALTEAVHLPNLIVLEIMAPLTIGSIDNLVLPSLRDLKVYLRTSNDISLIIGAPGIDLAKLERLSLFVTEYEEKVDLDELAMLFEAASNLDDLRCSNLPFAIAALELLLDLDNLYNKAQKVLQCSGSETRGRRLY